MINQGVYLIQNIINGKSYVGSTTDLKGRFRNHLWLLKIGKHGNNYLQYSFNKYGKDAFKTSILEIVEDEKDLSRKELDWILKLNTNNKEHGYNLSLPNPDLPPSGGIGRHAEESKEKIRRTVYKNNYGETSEEEYEEWKKSVYQNPNKDPNYVPKDYSLLVFNRDTGEKVGEYPSPAEAGRSLNIDIRKIGDVLNRRITNEGKEKRSCRGFVFVYKKDYNPELNYKVIKRIRKDAVINNPKPPKIKSDYIEKKTKPIIVECSNGEVLEFKSTTEGMKYFNIDKNKSKYMKMGIRKGHKRYGNLWKYKNIENT